MNGDREYTFELDGKARLEARLASGRLEIVAGPPGQAHVRVRGRDADAVRVEAVGGRLSVEFEQRLVWRGGPYDITVSLPEGSEADVRAASLDVTVETTLTALRAQLASGEFRGGDVEGEVSVKTASGDVRLGRTSGRVDVTSASGDVRIAETVGAVAVGTASGDVWVDRADADVSARSASGDLRVRCFRGKVLECRTMSGDVRVGLEPGRSVDVDLSTMSGDVHNAFAVTSNGGTQMRVHAKSVSGSIFLEAAES